MTRIFHRLFLWKWIPCQAVTSVLCLLFRPNTVHCSIKNVYTSEITFLTLVPWSWEHTVLMYSTPYNLWTFTWYVHFELPFRLKGTDKIHTKGLSKFHSNIYSILFSIIGGSSFDVIRTLKTWYQLYLLKMQNILNS